MEITFIVLMATLIILSAVVTVRLNKVDIQGAVFGAILSLIIWIGGGLESLFALFLFFILGTFASSWKKKTKQVQGFAQENDGKRGISNVLGNGGVAALLGIMSIISGDTQIHFNLMITASFATACSDTFSSEFGNIYGKKYYNIISFKQENRGVDGAISLAGLLFGLIGSSLVAISTLLFHLDLMAVILIIVCGLLGNLFDSILGATFQKNGYLNNHQVNFWATLLGALCALISQLAVNLP